MLFTNILRALDIRHASEAVRTQVDGSLRGRADEAQKPTHLITFGKAAVPMAEWFLDARDFQVVDGVVSAPDCQGYSWPGIRCFRGGHPVPNDASVRAGEMALNIARTATEDHVVVFLISGGGSALLEAPVDPTISLRDLQHLNDALVTCGAGIVEINVVRKHLSAVKGGRLAAAAFPAGQLTLYVSDVPEGQDSSVASGPTMPDDSTLDDLRRIIARHNLETQLPDSVRSLLHNPTLPETPKPGDRCFAASKWICVLANRHAIDAAGRFTEKQGWQTTVDTSVDDMDVGVAASRLLDRLRCLQDAERGKPVCVISGGELSSPVRGDGVGGRNQAFVLECVRRIAGERIAVLSAGTDGIDGNSPAAGAVADGTTLERARSLRMDPADCLARSDSHTFFKLLDDDITCGPTQNNVRDIRVLVSWP
ncbi:MAG: glycerate kinase [Candidatus Krumholzibacteriia bacterium]